MADDFYRVDADELEELMRDVFEALGVKPDEARTCAEVLIESDLKGIDSHGVARLKQKYFDSIKDGIQYPETNLETIRDRGAMAVFDGGHGMGMVIASRAMQTAIDKAKKFGLGMVTVRNSTHFGIAGYYSQMATNQDMIGITGTNARPAVAPTFGVENMMGTNPLTFGIPSDEEFPFLIDCATSLVQRGKVETYDRLGKELPEGWVIGEDGEAKTNPAQILKDLVEGQAALAPLGGIGEESGGHKGYGYAATVEILSAALSGANFLKALSDVKDGERVKQNLGHFFIAIDVSFFQPLEEVKKTTGDILRKLRNSRKAPGEDRIYTAGEKEYLARQKRTEEGIPLTAVTREELKQMLAELDLAEKWQGFLPE
jgi:LDH2 family malate/lactate/ureidoglycolate dehydrogenase